jgi:ferredoxin
VNRDERVRLRVNPIACTGHGVCAELLPELIRLDPWGYPLIADGMVPPHLAGHARRAAAACPTLALLTEDGSRAGIDGRPGGRHAG